MFRILALFTLALVGIGLFRTLLSLRRNIAIAKTTGIPYVVLPVYTFWVPWLLLSKPLYPFLQKLPKSWTESWLPFIHPEWVYTHGYLPFEKLNSDLILLVSPQRNHLYVASAIATSQIVTQRSNFPKPVEMYGDIDIYGKNVVTLEGSQWRAHRKLTAPSFSEKNNELVWSESILQAKGLAQSWGVDRTVPEPAQGTVTLALHVISKAGFGVRVNWPHDEAVVGRDVEKETWRFTGNEPLDGCTMSYKEAIQSLLENIIWLPVFPGWFLSRSPVEAHNKAFVASNDWREYMKEILKTKKAEAHAGNSSGGMDLIGALIRGSAESQTTGDAKSSSTGPGLTDDEILGNAFIFFLAGHETTANLLHFALILLALNPYCQVELQASIDSIFADKPDSSSWSYDEDFPKLFSAMPAAVMNETLRVIPSATGIPKCTEPGKPQRLSWEGGEVTVHGGCRIFLCTSSLNQNPKYWPPVPDQNGKVPHSDVSKFKPRRWLLDPTRVDSSTTHNIEADWEVSEGPSGPDTSPALWKPARGAFVPFSEGHRSCLGRRFSQVEMMAIFSYIFKFYSVELAVDDWASDEQVDKMNRAERKEVWNKAKDKAVHLLKTQLSTIITLQLREGSIPIRLVKRGEEKFWWKEGEGADDVDYVNPL